MNSNVVFDIGSGNNVTGGYQQVRYLCKISEMISNSESEDEMDNIHFRISKKAQIKIDIVEAENIGSF